MVFIFGIKKVPELARGFGKAPTESEKARIEAKKELQEIKRSQGNTTNVDREKLEAIADTLGIDYTNKSDDEELLSK